MSKQLYSKVKTLNTAVNFKLSEQVTREKGGEETLLAPKIDRPLKMFIKCITFQCTIEV